MPSRLTSTVLLTLVAVFFFNTSVFGVALASELYLHQLEQLEKIKNKKHKDVLQLRIQKHLVESRNAQFQWEKDWEFRWQGEMYDIEDSWLDGNTWVFFVKHDSKEDVLRKKMDRHAQDETNKRNAQSKKNLKCGEFFEKMCFSILNTVSPIAEATEQPQLSITPDRWVPDPPPWFI